MSRRAPSPWTARHVVCLCLLALLQTAAQAQWPRYRLDSLFPPGGTPGSTVEVSLTGEETELGDSLWFDHPGLSATHLEKNRFRITIAPEASPGRHDVRLVGPLGLSNPRSFLVDSRPANTETEPNNTPDKAVPLESGSVVFGQINGATDVDWFSVERKAGERLTVALDVSPLESRLDPLLRLFDPDRREIAISPDPDGDGADLEPLVDVMAEKDGRYTLQVTDRSYAGSPELVYRIGILQSPRIEAAMPLAVEPGKQVPLKLWGRNLAGGAAEPPGPGSTRLEHLEFSAQVPDSLDPEIGSLSSAPVSPLRAGRPTWKIQAPGAPDPSNHFSLEEARGSVVLEAEPNDGLSESDVQPVSPPCDISAAFTTPGDRDVYRFSARQGDVWIIEALGESIGSPVDLAFRLQKVDAEGKPPQDLGGAEDTADPGLAPVFSTASLDASMRWQVPADGTYQVVVSDLYGGQRGSPRLVYRLLIRPEQPDFRLFVAPLDPTRPEGPTLRAGGRGAFRILVARADGFDLPVEVEAIDLPAGLTSEPVVLAPGVSQAPLVIRASPELGPGLHALRFIGRAVRPDRKDMLATASGSLEKALSIEREAIPGCLVWAPPQNNQPALARVTTGFPVAMRPSSPFELDVSPATVVASPGTDFELQVKIRRHPGFDEAVQVTTDFLPPNMGGAEVTIPKETDSASLKLTVPQNVPPGPYTLLLRGTGSFPFQKNPAEDKKDPVKAIEPSNPVHLTVRKP